LGIAHNNMNSRAIYVYGNETIIIPYFDLAGDHPPPNHDTRILHLNDYANFIHDVKATVHEGVTHGDVKGNGQIARRIRQVPDDLDAIYSSVNTKSSTGNDVYMNVYNEWKRRST